MKRVSTNYTTSLQGVEVFEGETIEQKCARITENKEPITDGAPIIYTLRQEGVRPEYNIRTDRFDIALEAMDAVNKVKQAKRDGKFEAPEQEIDNPESPTGEQPAGN